MKYIVYIKRVLQIFLQHNLFDIYVTLLNGQAKPACSTVATNTKAREGQDVVDRGLSLQKTEQKATWPSSILYYFPASFIAWIHRHYVCVIPCFHVFIQQTRIIFRAVVNLLTSCHSLSLSLDRSIDRAAF